jgi:hypothetical protein
VDELIGLVSAVDGICRMQATADAEYFLQTAGREFDAAQARAISDTLLAAYRGQYIVSGVQDARFLAILGSMIDAGRVRASTPRWPRSSALATEDSVLFGRTRRSRWP